MPLPTKPYRVAELSWRREYWNHLLSQTGGNVREAATLAGTNRTFTYKLLRQLGISAANPNEPRQRRVRWDD